MASLLDLRCVAMVVIVMTSAMTSRTRVASETELLLKDILQELKGLDDASETGRCSATEVEAVAWLQDINDVMRQYSNEVSDKNWDYITNITDYNEQRLLEVQKRVSAWNIATIQRGRKYLKTIGDKFCNATAVRQLRLLTNGGDYPLPNNPQTRERIDAILSKLTDIYSSASTVKDGKVYRLEPELTEIMDKSRDYNELLWAWVAYQNMTGPRMRSLYIELVEKFQEGAVDQGVASTADQILLSDYDQDDIEPMIDRLYEEIKPFYAHLHAYTRRKLAEHYKQDVVDSIGPIQAHLLGNMWAQDWSSIIDLVLPYEDAPSINVTAAMLKKGYNPLRMFQLSEDFYTSIGLEKMTSIFWKKSMIERPQGREVVCHGSADDFNAKDDYRIKMCTTVTEEMLYTVHHEMGHVEYYMQYRHQPTIFRSGANAAFHEAVGDTIALSVVTSEHLQKIGLADMQPEMSGDSEYKAGINSLMKKALQKIAFLPFAYTIDKWRFEVLRGQTTPDKYNARWWQIKKQYQGIVPPVPRTENDFDPGSKFHIAAHVPYYRYFLSFVGQFQFFKSLCDASGHQGPLYRCDFYQSEAAGQRLKSMLSLGASRPWSEAMYMMTGQSEFQTDGVMLYFQPLLDWLRKENEGHVVGW